MRVEGTRVRERVRRRWIENVNEDLREKRWREMNMLIERNGGV